jgi:hypothetical protein
MLEWCKHFGDDFQKGLGINRSLIALAPYAVMAAILFVVALKKAPKLESQHG